MRFKFDIGISYTNSFYTKSEPKSFANGKKILLIPPTLVNDQLVTTFLEKANLF